MVRTNIFTIECLSRFMNNGTLFRNYKVLSQMTGKMFSCSMPQHCRVCNTFIKPRSDDCIARVSMICLMLLKAWLIGPWLLIISPGKSCWCSVDIISIVMIIIHIWLERKSLSSCVPLSQWPFVKTHYLSWQEWPIDLRFKKIKNLVCKYFSYNFKWAFYETNILGNKFCDLKTSPRSIMNTKIMNDWGGQSWNYSHWHFDIIWLGYIRVVNLYSWYTQDWRPQNWRPVVNPEVVNI